MCFYDQSDFICGCAKWGHFRQHCSKEYRTGETCGIRLVMNRYMLQEKCKICIKMDTKHRSITKQEDNIRRWRRETGRSASIEKAQGEIAHLERELERLDYERQMKLRDL